MFTIEMAYARMREMQDQANRSRVHQSAAGRRAKKAAARAKKR
ncbi:hypothetical protein AB0J38_34730 [Streptomyces sp. NPDC050095]